MSTVRLCKDCRWAALEERNGEMVWVCTHSRSVFVPLPDYVTGKPVTPRQMTCAEARMLQLGDDCGPQGQYWEARD